MPHCHFPVPYLLHKEKVNLLVLDGGVPVPSFPSEIEVVEIRQLGELKHRSHIDGPRIIDTDQGD